MLFGARFFGRLYMSLMRPRDLLRGLLISMTEAARDRDTRRADNDPVLYLEGRDAGLANPAVRC